MNVCAPGYRLYTNISSKKELHTQYLQRAALECTDWKSGPIEWAQLLVTHIQGSRYEEAKFLRKYLRW